MAQLVTRDYVCDDCQLHSILTISREEDHWQPRVCPDCGGVFRFKMHVNINTSKTSESIVDVVAKNRFSDIKEQRKWKKMARTARQSGNKSEAIAIKKEANKSGFKI